MLITLKLFKENPAKVAEVLGTKKVYSIHNLCEVIGVSRPTVYSFIRKGYLVEAPYRIEKLLLWRQEDLDQLMINLSNAKQIVVVEDVE